VTGGGRAITVCKRAFISLFGISMKKVNLIQKSIKLGKSAPEPDRRGKHTVRPNKTPAEVAGYVIEHISSFPAEESHYSRHCNIQKIYLSPLLSIPRMHKLYLDKCRNDGKGKLFLIKDATYRFIFNNEFNLSFGHPKNDTFSSCDSGCATNGSIKSVNSFMTIFLLAAQYFGVLKNSTMMLVRSLHCQKVYNQFNWIIAYVV
jgi:hypothetical protein